jgi:hypothetical protein
MGFLPFLRFELEKVSNVSRLEMFFTETAVERAAEAVWDAEEGCAITPDDLYVDAMFDTDEEYDLSGGDTENATNGDTAIIDQTPPDRPDPRTLNTTLYGADTDSVTTMGTKGKQTGKPAPRPKKPDQSIHLQPGTSTVRTKRPPGPPSLTSSSHTSAASEVTPSVILELTARMDGFQKDIGKLDGLVKKIDDLSGLGTQLERLIAAATMAGGPVGLHSDSAGSNGAVGEGS